MKLTEAIEQGNAARLEHDYQCVYVTRHAPNGKDPCLMLLRSQTIIVPLSHMTVEDALADDWTFYRPDP